MHTWAQQGLPGGVSEVSRTYLLALFEQHVDPGLAWLRAEGSEYLPSVDIALVTSLATLLQVCALLLLFDVKPIVSAHVPAVFAVPELFVLLQLAAALYLPSPCCVHMFQRSVLCLSCVHCSFWLLPHVC